MALGLRPQDKRELIACYGLPVREGLEVCLQKSVCAVGFFYRGKLCAASGLEPRTLLGKEACVWSWTTGEITRCQKSFFQISKYVLECFSAFYPVLYAACATDYQQARRYLEHLGAVVQPPFFRLADANRLFCLYRFVKPFQTEIYHKEKLWEEQ